MKLIHIVTAGLVFGLSMASAGATSLRVSPVGLDLKAGTAASTIRVWNNEKAPVNVQVRVFRWTKVNGKDRLEPTKDVVASPPMTRLGGGSENLIRVVRVTKRPIDGKESYRLMVDELPDPKSSKPGTVNVVVRHSIPVHFSQ